MDGQGHDLVALANARMPFGRYAGRHLVRLPEEYLLWFEQRGFPEGELGRRLAAMLEIKVNGLERLLLPLITEP
jgi:uncharacterized protein (DUF3820 family)